MATTATTRTGAVRRGLAAGMAALADLALLAGGIAIVVAAFLPWTPAQNGNAVGPFHASRLEFWGTIGIGGVITLLGLMAMMGWMAITKGMVTAMCAIACAWAALLFAGAEPAGQGHLTIAGIARDGNAAQYGLWVLGGGTLLALCGAILGVMVPRIPRAIVAPAPATTAPAMTPAQQRRELLGTPERTAAPAGSTGRRWPFGARRTEDRPLDEARR